MPNLPTLTTLAAFALLTPAAAFAHPPYVSAFNAAYPTSTLSARTSAQFGMACFVCHQPPNGNTAGNCYRIALKGKLSDGMDIAAAIAAIGNEDSDNDGVANATEILMPHSDLAGEVGFNPGLIGATGTDPCGPDATSPVTNVRETPPPPCPADFNHAGGVSVQDIFDFLGAWFAGDPRADFNGFGGISVQDIFDFLAAWFRGC